jgi:hypothetical protein
MRNWMRLLLFATVVAIITVTIAPPVPRAEDVVVEEVIATVVPALEPLPPRGSTDLDHSTVQADVDRRN